MKIALYIVSVVSVVMCVAPLAWGQTPAAEPAQAAPAMTLETPPPEMVNKIGLNYRMGLNITVDFKKLGGLALSDPGPVAGSAVNRNYDDGYNRVDSTGNNHGGFIGTWYWGYQSSSSAPGNDTLVLQSYRTLPNATSNNRQDDPQHGFEITYSRELYRAKNWRAGLEAALGYTRLSIGDSQTLKNTTYRTNDAFALNGVVPPPGGYAGTTNGPGLVISSMPSGRAVTALVRTATITGSRDLDADVFTLRLGPYAEVPLYKKLSLIFSGGLTLAVGRTDFSFREDVEISDPAYGVNLVSQHRTGSGSQTDFLVGGYVGGSLAYALTKQLSLVVGGQFQAAGQAVNTEKSKQAILDLGKSVIVSIGATFSF